MNERQPSDELAREALEGDLRPQFNPHAPLRESRLDLKAVEGVLLERFFHLSRPIGNSALGPRDDLRLSDANRFFYLVETLRRSYCPHIEETLLVILDEFLELTEASYNELYLWSIVELSRTDPKHVEVFWPAVIALDQRHRLEPWVRPLSCSPADEPYRMCELLFYYYALYTIHLKNATPPVPSMGRCLHRIAHRLTPEQIQLVGETLRQMGRDEEWQALYGDAYGMLMNPNEGFARRRSQTDGESHPAR